MPISLQIDRSKQLTICRATGMLSFDEVTASIRSFYAANPTLTVLCDLRRASAEQISSKDVRQIAELIRQFNKDRQGGRTAIVSESGVTYGVARMLETIISIPGNDFGYQLRVFRDINIASEWLERTE